jgi:hypothetical protein
MPTLLTQGAASARAYGFGASSAPPVYIEDVFSTYLYTGTGGSQTITNGIDLSTKGGMVWIKSRSDATNNFLFDTARGSQKEINSNTTDAEVSLPYSLGPFNTNGFTIGNATGIGVGAATYASWTFREQAKFFDVVTYTGNGTTQNISHNLGSTPGCIFVKATSSATNWCVYHRSVGNTGGLILNGTNATITDSGFWNNTSPTSTQFTVGSGSAINVNSVTYVAYLFAHDAGGFGATGTDNVISCGSYTGTGAAGNFVSLGYEPQWVLIKRSDTTQDWFLFDNMRGIVTGTGGDLYLNPNTTGAEGASGTYIAANATGFTLEGTTSGFNSSGGTYIYIAIRRGPMKTPTTGTSVFSPVARAGTSSASSVTGLNFSPDSILIKNRAGSSDSVDWSFNFFDRLRFPGYRLSTAFTDAEDTTITFITSINMDGITFNSPGYTATNGSGYNYINYFFRRAPGFFDEVCYRGTGGVTSVPHNLTVPPELMIIKRRDGAQNWAVYSTTTGPTGALYLNDTGTITVNSNFFNNTNPTASSFTVGITLSANTTTTWVAYLFATVAGVSKVGSYTGTAALQTINCGFTGGARFVLIKRTDSTGAWYVWDSARGISSINDPYLLLNSTAAEVTGTNYVDTTSTGFQVTAAAPAGINANGGTYIFLAIA